MHIAIFAVGRLKKGAEADLADLYTERFAKAGALVGLQFDGVHNIGESRAPTPEQRKEEEAAALQAGRKRGCLLVLLDERGKNLSSRAFARNLQQWRDKGQQNLLLALGGPDGFAEAMRGEADIMLAFGAMTWPHRLARIMLAEQLYRAALILAGHPYHRD
ncbi:MAG: 23S rRNA (pseudouridine(1915)-N(3))-methyltransferase RlmH [Candidatus Tokpelaia sp.]|uniref:23S rRNA (pseudouridine(1915)-N(3))-methyltransferase RlmH n=1 Tax=Candidatus Tokpelaia sp. TaxID=2233777 RepID=UPI00123AAE77|nr:23S rRNA (pseudouridine(1915)-N(3))-methyltransferase RlmH [Candidatus Tokpelaia sp.]KAA6205163.1 MAG: 23S rRNA (pseudouridine(1915)-N(3))-methyltransferase RlmH [Candidatus Tokpelaia sp.]KAA6207374.1 MAG: 23S rRNA (pseudouridine(1915)-N(3))-methyltransferase RlmH [Candidatus Tokpelaia sp.]KAA6405115.1 23S rRNA (pseudouridine(1915)-N(3))-methyltransferase RlmH [Candidatus Tokpelaia sp.]